MDPGDIGTRFDDPADVDALLAGEPASLFGLLKAILLELKLMRAAMTDGDLQTQADPRAATS